MVRRNSRKLTTKMRVCGVALIGLGCWVALPLSIWRWLEPTAQAATFTVNSTADTDDGVCNVANCTLREAINAANTAAGADKIFFNIAGGGVKTITIVGGLPTITGVVAIDGTTQPGFASTPLIELNGQNAGGSGFRITAGSSTIKSLIINRFPAHGILIDTNGSNLIEGNYIGTDATGGVDQGNTLDGIHIDGSANNTIGGTTTSSRNIISGNNQYGIFITSNGSTGNKVQGNYIGTNAVGASSRGNSLHGVYINAASNNTIGGTTAGASNVISGNSAYGVYIDNGGSGNVVQGNFIGTNPAGATSVPNAGNGVTILNAPNNIIGGTTAGARNVISGNNLFGISLSGNTTTGNQIQGNYIGTDATGTSSVSNNTGVSVGFAPNNIIGGTSAGARNVISGNNGHGIEIFGNTATGNLVQGNYIGTNVAGGSAIPNTIDGVRITAANNTIGGTSVGARNIISGNTQDGVEITGATATGNLVQGNYIGIDVNGVVNLGNTRTGIEILNAPNNIIGGTTVGARNVISGNQDVGIIIQRAGSTGNQVQGNYIGTDAAGTFAIPNTFDGVVISIASNNIIGGTSAGARNIISGNMGNGVGFFDATSTGNLVQGNYIGTNAAGTSAIFNTNDGVRIENAPNNTIGGTSGGSRNIISGNAVHGIEIVGNTATGNVVQGNYIGTDVNGNVDLGNDHDGVLITSPNNTIGGTVVGARNVISGNNQFGISISANGTIIQGNYIGTNAGGNVDLGNSLTGVRVGLLASNNTIGGTTAGAGNVISGNDSGGVEFITQSSGGVVQGNFIGTDAAGNAALPNVSDGIALSGTGHTLGGTTVSARNVIAGHNKAAVELYADANGCLVQGNYIGTGLSGTTVLGNPNIGVLINGNANHNTIGGTSNGAGNLIAFSGNDAVRVQVAANVANSIRRNAIFSSSGLGIALGLDGGVTPNDAGDGDTGPNNLQNFPVLTSAVSLGGNTTIQGTLNSTASTQFSVDLYANNACDSSGNGEGQNFITSTTVTTNGSGDASFTLTVPSNTVVGQFITATATDPDGNTSEFSACATLQSGSGVQFSATSYNVVEDCTTVTITVNRLGDTSSPATVDYFTTDVTATERRDYVTAIGKLRFAAGESSKVFAVLINEDSYIEGNETFNITLANPSGVALGAPALASVQITDDLNEPTANVIDDPQNFVCQHYHDFLNRQPDASGLAFWTDQITSCGNDQACIQLKRINVSAAFYLSIEFQDTGYLVERIYKTAYGNATGTSTFGGNHNLPVPIVRLSEFLPDTQQIGLGVVVGQPGWEQVLENNKQAFTSEFVLRSRFTTAFPGSLTPAQFVDALNANAGNPLSQPERDQLVSELTSGVKTRAQVLRAVAQDSDLNNSEKNRAFVLMQYFGYLRRNPNDPQDTDYTGFDFWLTKLNEFSGNFVNAEMVKAFITSGEYRQRFGQ